MLSIWISNRTGLGCSLIDAVSHRKDNSTFFQALHSSELSTGRSHDHILILIGRGDWFRNDRGQFTLPPSTAGPPVGHSKLAGSLTMAPGNASSRVAPRLSPPRLPFRLRHLANPRVTGAHQRAGLEHALLEVLSVDGEHLPSSLADAEHGDGAEVW
jgi:hypothetical protein